MIVIVAQISVDTPVNFWFLMITFGSVVALIIIGKLFATALEEIKELKNGIKELKRLLGRSE